VHFYGRAHSYKCSTNVFTGKWLYFRFPIVGWNLHGFRRNSNEMIFSRSFPEIRTRLFTFLLERCPHFVMLKINFGFRVSVCFEVNCKKSQIISGAIHGALKWRTN